MRLEKKKPSSVNGSSVVLKCTVVPLVRSGEIDFNSTNSIGVSGDH